MVCLADHIPSTFLKVVSHKFYLVHSWILCPICNIVLGYLEIQFHEKRKNEFGVSNEKYIEENWHRYLDDCYIALDVTNINPLKLFDIFDNIHDNVKFTMKQHNLYLLFLDIMTNKDSASNNIWNDILYKKHWYSEMCSINSCHTKQRKNNIHFTLAASIYIENLRAWKAKTESSNLAFVTTFKPNYKKVFPLIQTAFKSLLQLYETKECFKDIKLIKSQRQASNLKKRLLELYIQKEHYSKKCTKIRCTCCDYIKEDSFYIFKTRGDIFYLKEYMTRESSN